MQQLIMKRIAELQDQLNKLKDEAAREESTWEGKLKSFDDGTVVVFDKIFYGSKVYTYAAIKKDDLWYLTNTGGKSHIELANFLGERTPYVLRLKAQETIYREGRVTDIVDDLITATKKRRIY